MSTTIKCRSMGSVVVRSDRRNTLEPQYSAVVSSPPTQKKTELGDVPTSSHLFALFCTSVWGYSRPRRKLGKWAPSAPTSFRDHHERASGAVRLVFPNPPTVLLLHLLHQLVCKSSERLMHATIQTGAWMDRPGCQWRLASPSSSAAIPPPQPRTRTLEKKN